MILRARGRDVELRSEFGSWPIPWSHLGDTSGVGGALTDREAFGLPAVGSVIRSPAEIIATLPFIVYRQGEERARATESWQYELLHDKPMEERSSFEFFYDVALSLEATQNAFVQKVHGKSDGRSRLFGLIVLDPQRVSGHVDKQTGRKLFDVWVSPDDVRRDLTTDDILHVRGFTPQPGGAFGVSLIQFHRDPLGATKAMQSFEGDYFRNATMTPLIFNLGSQGSVEKATALQDAWELQHKGPGNQFKVGTVWGVEGIEKIPLSLQDAAFVEAKQVSVQDVARIWNWPLWMLGVPDAEAPDVNGRMSELLRVNLLWRLRRIERAFAGDHDLLWRTGLFGEFLTAALERADIKTRYEAYLKARQAGWRTANEIRRDENEAPHPDGDRLQQTPVGGAPNDGAQGAEEDAEAASQEAARGLNGHREIAEDLLARS